MLETIILFILRLFSMGLDGVEVTVPDAATTSAAVLHVVDGDTIVVDLDGTTERVRYIGIDTPELHTNECYAQQAHGFNTYLVADQIVTLVRDQEDRDRFDRLLRYVYIDDMSVQAALLRDGFAVTLPIEPNIRFAADYRALEKSARANEVGMWSVCKKGDK